MKRIQRKRTKGWKMPENAIYVGRPTKWGNPYKVGDLIGPFLDGPRLTAKNAVERYRYWLAEQIKCEWLDLNELRGKDLACFCREGEPCHADVLIEFCNEKTIQARD
jgi:hypothetical protein